MPKITDQEYRSQLKDLVEQAREMHQKGKYKNPEYGKLCMAVVELIEGSNLGRQEAESELELEVKQNPFDEMLDGSFDGVAMQLMNMSSQYLGRFGEVSMNPYSQGLTTRSAKVRFKPRK